MTVKTGQAWAGTFVTLDSTGALAAGSPAGVLYVDGVANGATVTISGSNPYKWAVTLPTLTAGQRCDMYITATIATIATAGVVASEQADTALTSEVKTETAAILADTGTDGVVVASLATDSITAAALKADAVTKIQNGLALEATLTAIKGAGWTDETLAALDALIDAIKAKTDQFVFTTPNKVDASATVDPTGIATAAALAVVDANVDAIKVKTDALDNSAVTFVTAVNGTTITVLRGDTLSGALTDIGALTDYVSIDFTVKQNYSQTDDEAIIRIRKNASGTDDGLLRFNGEAPSSGALGSIAIDDLASGDITIALAASCTDDLSTGTYVYDIQMISAAGVKTLTYGKLIVSADVTRLVS